MRTNGGKGGSNDHPSAPGDTLLRCTPRLNSDDADQQISEVLLEADPDDRFGTGSDPPAW